MKKLVILMATMAVLFFINTMAMAEEKIIDEWDVNVDQPKSQSIENLANENSAKSFSHQPQAGFCGGTNELGNWYGAWAKYKLNFNTTSSWVPGIGFLGNYTFGDADEKEYKWDEGSVGPLFGLKKFGKDGQGYPWMVEADVAPQFYWLKGENNSSGYENKQEGYKLNLRVEAKKLVSENWTAGGIVEGNIDLGDSKFESSWEGDSPSDRSSIEVGGYGLYRINDDLEYQAYVGVFNQQWDEMTGVKVMPLEIRYHKWLIIGAGISFYPFGLSDQYEGVAKASDLITQFCYIRVDFGN